MFATPSAHPLARSVPAIVSGPVARPQLVYP